MEAYTTALIHKAADWTVRVVGVLIVLLIALLIARWLQRAIERAMQRRRVDPTLIGFIGNLVRYAILISSVVACLGVFGIQTTSIAAILGSAWLAVGLAFQGTLSNFAAGVMLLIFRPFRVDDSIKVAGVTGTVSKIELFSTDLITSDNRKIIIPNKDVFGNTIENLTALTTRRVDLRVMVDHSADLERTEQSLVRAAKQIELVLQDPAPSAEVVSLNESNMEWEVRAWCQTSDHSKVRGQLIRTVKSALAADRIDLPLQKLDVNLSSKPQGSTDLTKI